MNSPDSSTSAAKQGTTPPLAAKIALLIPWSIVALLGLLSLYLGFGWWDACIKQESLQNQLAVSELRIRDTEQKLAAEIILSRQQIERLRVLTAPEKPKN